jgi:hypothetical protein
MKKIFFSLLIILFIIQNIYAQTDHKPLTYEDILSLDDSTHGNIAFYLLTWTQAYYSAYFDLTTDIDKFFHYNAGDATTSIFWDNKDSLRLERVDNGLIFYYNEKFLFIVNVPIITCKQISCGSYNRIMVNSFDKEGNSVWLKRFEKSFQRKRVQIYKKCIKEGYKTLIFPNDTLYREASNRPLIIAYQYDIIQGLSIHKLCSCDYQLEQNLYTQELAALADKCCKKYKLSKIIFAARVMGNVPSGAFDKSKERRWRKGEY